MLTQIMVVLFISARFASASPQWRPGGAIIAAIKFFWSNSPNGTVSKFPPIIEYLVQRIQTQNSDYIHEDLSRPPTWEKPVYTLAPSTAHPVEEKATEDPYEYEQLEETTEKFFEIITGSE